MAIEKVEITVSTIQELLRNGYTWLKKDDLGYGSIQEKFNANDSQIAIIRKHPMLKDLDTEARIFVIIDDTKNGSERKTEETATSSRTVFKQEVSENIDTSDTTDTSAGFVESDASATFLNL